MAFKSVMKPTPPHRILLTGASGTLGRNLLELLGNNPDYTILVLLRKESRPLLEWKSMMETRLDLLDQNAVTKVVHDFQPQTIVHAAATGMEFPKTEWFDLIRFNVDFTVNLCESAACNPEAHFIYISTGLCYRPLPRSLREDDALDTLHPYGASKAAADLLIRSAAVEFGLPLTVLRPFSFTGVGDDRSRLFPSILRAAQTGMPLDLTDGRQVRDHISARDVAEGIRMAMDKIPNVSHGPEIYNLGGGSTMTVRAMIENVVGCLGIKVKLNFGSKPPSLHDPRYLVADFAKATHSLGWQPRHDLTCAVWELARDSFPDLNLSKPSDLPYLNERRA